MFELPLPPQGNLVRAAQRRLAQHGVILIPNSVLLDVLLSPQTTQDSLHLNGQGQRQLVESVRLMLKERMTEDD